MSGDLTAWGSDVPVSMPEPVDPSEILVDFGSHAFTPDGLKVYMSAAVREDVIASAWLPVDAGRGADG